MLIKTVQHSLTFTDATLLNRYSLICEIHKYRALIIDFPCRSNEYALHESSILQSVNASTAIAVVLFLLYVLIYSIIRVHCLFIMSSYSVQCIRICSYQVIVITVHFRLYSINHQLKTLQKSDGLVL